MTWDEAVAKVKAAEAAGTAVPLTEADYDAFLVKMNREIDGLYATWDRAQDIGGGVLYRVHEMPKSTLPRDNNAYEYRVSFYPSFKANAPGHAGICFDTPAERVDAIYALQNAGCIDHAAAVRLLNAPPEEMRCTGCSRIHDYRFPAPKEGDKANHHVPQSFTPCTGYWTYYKPTIPPLPFAPDVPAPKAKTKPLQCSVCNESNDFAEPNQPNGTFVCYPCRQQH